jgi:hypothetical protein
MPRRPESPRPHRRSTAPHSDPTPARDRSISPKDAPDSPAQREALPIARRLAAEDDGRPGRFPLLFRPDAAQERLPMVGWFDPGQLLDTGVKAIASALVGERSDRRVVQALAARHQDYYDYTVHYADGADGPVGDEESPREEIWIDYVCDTGDGWHPTYAVAYALAQPSLELRDPAGDAHATERGQLLVFGGDLVYPTASREQYQRRLVAPFEAASSHMRPREAPHVFAIPGNHDWYDGLSAFLRLFCSDVGGRDFGAWHTRQDRSYFALRLPGRWWLLGSDSQLQDDIDVPQIEYFADIAERHMKPGDRVILCLSTPVWIYAHKYRQLGKVFDETDLLYLREQVFARRGIDLKVFLAGDLHHYRRHEESAPLDPRAPIQKITAGGGGAFLHPTHDEDVSHLSEVVTALDEDARLRARDFDLKASYPSLRESWWLSFGNLLFAARNPRFGVVPGLLYLLTAWLVGSTVGYAAPQSAADALGLTVSAFALNPGLALWLLAVLGAFVAFNNTRSRLHRWLGGLSHAAAHWVLVFHIGWGAASVGGWLFPGAGLAQFAAAGALVFAGGWIAGSAIMGAYLLVSLNVFGRHSNEAFSSLAIQDYKHFLRLHVARDGTLTIFPIRLHRVPRRWRERTAADGDNPARLVPDQPLQPDLIEPPIVLRPPVA